MNVLCDRHHAGLLYSLQLLLEDRLGFDLYVPVGRTWWDEGYWQFGRVFGDDRLARQYLYDPEEHGWVASTVGYSTRDVEFPTREIRGVTLAQFRDLGDWEFVVASVQENQRGFKQLADEVGARYVVQVGNAGQRVDWDLNPLALISAEAPIPAGGHGVYYHQEFDKDGVFHFRAGAPSYPIRSFVNCFNRMPEQWARFQRLEFLLQDRVFKVHGHDGRDGLVQPTGAVANTMAASSLAWHDKPQGDGFGHVLHYWAAVGRPLIGTRAYYRGKLAEPLWEDGVTAICLDGKSDDRVAHEIRELLSDSGRYYWMSRALRSRLDNLVDFDAEERAIRRLLE